MTIVNEPLSETPVALIPRSPSMPFDKPEIGWTKRAGLSSDEVAFDDSTDPRYHADELEAVFRRSWVNVGRDIEIPEGGDYFTRELPGLNVSLIVARGRDGVVRAFYNMCTHRGNKLLWDDHPNKEICGSARRFQCKYHGWQFDPEGQLRFVNKEKWFDGGVDKETHGLVPVACDTWMGFIFVNFADEPAQTLQEHLGPFWDGLADYPFQEMTQTFRFQCDAKANWKIFLDAMVEQYHGNTLHYKLVDPVATSPLRGAIGSRFEVFEKNSIWEVAVPAASFSSDDRRVLPAHEMFESNLWGPGIGRDIGVGELPEYLNITRHEGWTNSMFHVYPNFDMLVWKRDWMMYYTTWPTAADQCRFEARMYFPPPRNASDRLAQEVTAVEFKEFLLQDANLLECAQSMLAMDVRPTFPLNDEEVLVRNIHHTVRVDVENYRRERAAAGNGQP